MRLLERLARGWSGKTFQRRSIPAELFSAGHFQTSTRVLIDSLRQFDHGAQSQHLCSLSLPFVFGHDAEGVFARLRCWKRAESGQRN